MHLLGMVGFALGSVPVVLDFGQSVGTGWAAWRRAMLLVVGTGLGLLTGPGRPQGSGCVSS